MEEKSMYINHNGMATNVANTLTSHYSNLSTSTQRLSSGMRINSAADDAAGMAISELMRADIAALNQGVRNANDAISLIQTADGALGVIDEKLIRMKELAEQASTGTYDSTQRLMIDSEYQQMASEITRIANATDFNGVKLLDGTLSGVHDGSQATATGAMKVHFGTSNDSAEDYYYIEIGEATAQAFGLGSASTWEDATNRLAESMRSKMVKAIENDDTLTTEKDRNAALRAVDAVVNDFRTKLTAMSEGTAAQMVSTIKIWDGSNATRADDFTDAGRDLATGSMDGVIKDLTKDTDGDGTVTDAEIQASYEALSDRDKQKVAFAFGMATLEKWASNTTEAELNTEFGTDAVHGKLGTIQANGDMEAKDLDGNNNALATTALQNARLSAIKDTLHEKGSQINYAGQSIATQEDAQIALDAIQNAIVEKDKIRAHLGATQNRLENTVTNLTIQSENLQNAESRIRDADVATEMANFVRNQVLTQSAVAMLSQANSMPQMARQLIG